MRNHHKFCIITSALVSVSLIYASAMAAPAYKDKVFAYQRVLGHDSPGNDLYSIIYTLPKDDVPQICMLECNNMGNCNAFYHVFDAEVARGKSVCFFKTKTEFPLVGKPHEEGTYYYKD